MRRGNLASLAASLLAVWSSVSAAWGLVADDPPKPTADERFDTLYREAMKAPEKADWKALRGAFAETSWYEPYGNDVTEKLEEVAQAFGRGQVRESEAELLRLLEREKCMRIDTVAMLMMLYVKTKEPEKAAKYAKIVEGVLGVLKYPKAGTSFDKPIEVLFIEEEYLVATGMPIKMQEMTIHDGRRFDVLVIKAGGDEPEKKLYFDIELPHEALSRSLSQELRPSK